MGGVANLYSFGWQVSVEVDEGTGLAEITNELSQTMDL